MSKFPTFPNAPKHRAVSIIWKLITSWRVQREVDWFEVCWFSEKGDFSYITNIRSNQKLVTWNWIFGNISKECAILCNNFRVQFSWSCQFPRLSGWKWIPVWRGESLALRSRYLHNDPFNRTVKSRDRMEWCIEDWHQFIIHAGKCACTY